MANEYQTTSLEFATKFKIKRLTQTDSYYNYQLLEKQATYFSLLIAFLKLLGKHLSLYISYLTANDIGTKQHEISY